MKAPMVLLCSLCLCGCGTISLLPLAQAAHEIVDTQMYLHRSPKQQDEPAPPLPARKASGTSAVAARLSAGNSQARVDRPGGTDAASSRQDSARLLEGSTPPEDAISPPSPAKPPESSSEGQFVLEPSVESLWNEYRAFHYEAVLRNADSISAKPGLDDRQKAAALIIAGSAAYVLGNQELARDTLARAAVLAPDVCPDSQVFPSTVCAMHKNFVLSKP